MPGTPTWLAAGSGLAAVAGQNNQFLAEHFAENCYQGAILVAGVNTGFIAYNSLGQYVDQPFVMPAAQTEIDRVELFVYSIGAGADISVSLYSDSGGSPLAALLSIAVPLEFLQPGGAFLSIPLIVGGLTPGATYHIVSSPGGAGGNSVQFAASPGAGTPKIKTSVNGTVWSAPTPDQLYFNVFNGQTGLLRNVLGDGGAWAALEYNAQNVLINTREYIGPQPPVSGFGVRQVRTLSYAGSGNLQSVV